MTTNRPSDTHSDPRNEPSPAPAAAPAEWGPCKSGEITQMVRREQARAQWRTVAKYGALAATAAVLLVGVMWSLPNEYEFGGITCKECASHATPYFRGEIKDADLRESMRVHLRDCPKCSEHFRDAQAWHHGTPAHVVARR